MGTKKGSAITDPAPEECVGYVWLGFLGSFSCPKPQCPQANETIAKQEHGWGYRDRAAAEAVAAEVGAAATEVLGGVIVGDKIVYQRHCPIERDGPPAQNFCARIKANTVKSKNIACEHSI